MFVLDILVLLHSTYILNRVVSNEL